MTRVITISLLIARVCARALPRFIWFEFVGNIYDLAFTAKLTLIWSQALIYDLPALINVQLQLKMQHLHFAVSASAIRINMYTHFATRLYSSILFTSPSSLLRLFRFELRNVKGQIFTQHCLQQMFFIFYLIFCLMTFLRVDSTSAKSQNWSVNPRVKFLSAF